jgi:hypothetical protein
LRFRFERRPAIQTIQLYRVYFVVAAFVVVTITRDQSSKWRQLAEVAARWQRATALGM